MSNTLPASVEFSGANLSIIDHNGQPWLSAADLSRGLGYADTSAVSRIYARHEAEFSEEMAGTVKLTGPGNLGEIPVRIFSPRGCHLVAMFAHTEKAAAFRRWVLDVLEGLATPPAPQPMTTGLPLPQREADLLRAYLETMLSRFCGTSPAEAELQELRGLVDGMQDDLHSARRALEHAEDKAKQLAVPRNSPMTFADAMGKVINAEWTSSPLAEESPQESTAPRR